MRSIRLTTTKTPKPYPASLRRWLPAFCVLALGMAPASALDLVRDGKPLCAIVIPDEPTVLEREGADTLAKYLAQAVGTPIPVANESSRPSGTVISLGKTALARAAGITDEGLEFDGYRMAVKDGTLFLLGRDQEVMAAPPGHGDRIGAQGSRRVALDFLQRLGFRWLVPSTMGTHVPTLATVSVPDDLNVTHRPPFMYVAGRMYTWGDWSIANSFRKASRLFSAGGHTWCQAVPDSLWEEHPEYFRMQGGQRIRPTSGDIQHCPSNPEVVRRITDYTLGKFAQGFDLVALGQPDGWKPCECGPCQALGRGTGYEASEQVHATQRAIIEACRAKFPDRYIHLIIYGPTQNPPHSFDRYPSNTLAELAPPTDENLRFWKNVVPAGATSYVYYMGLYQNVGGGPGFTPAQAAREMRMLHTNGVKGIYFCGAGEKWGTEGPTYYVLGRLAGDPSVDWRLAMDEYCTLLFGAAGPTMRQYYDLLYDRIDHHHDQSAATADVFTATYTPDILERLAGLLALARRQAAGNEKALGFIRVADIGFRHLSLIARSLHLYQAYQIRPTREGLEHIRDAVAEYQQFVAQEVPDLLRQDPDFVAAYFPNAGLWMPDGAEGGRGFRDNYSTLTAPFTWNFDALLEAGVLPGKDRARMTIPRLAAAPAVDGSVDDGPWADVPWVDIREASLGETEATTRMKAGFDDDRLYFAFECREPLADEMVVIENGRDGKVFNTECVEMFLAPDGAGQKRMQICASPTKAGIWDGRYGYIDDPVHPLNLSGAPDVEWNPAHAHAFRIDKPGKRWTLEITFPFKELGVDCPAAGSRWRGNFGRERHKWAWGDRYPGQKEYFLWAPNLQGGGLNDPGAFGDLFFGAAPAETRR